MQDRRKRMATVAFTVLAGLMLLPASGQASTEFGSRLTNEPSEVKCLVLGSCTIEPGAGLVHDR
jgi:hypothetical protein